MSRSLHSRRPFRSFVVAFLGLAPPLAASADENWPSFRGPFATGVADGHDVPTEWDASSGRHVAWRARIPGLSHSSPVLWGERLFVTTAVREGGESALKLGLYGSPNPEPDEGLHQHQVWCLDKHSGAVLWVRTAVEATPAVKRHTKGSHAASTAALDDRHLVAFFASEGLYCYDHDGQLLWDVDLGTLDSGWYVAPDAQFGFASSPVIHDGRVIVQCDIQEGSFLCALDVHTGEELWRTEREEVPTWGTPTIFPRASGTQILVNGYRHMGAYDFATGSPRWSMANGGDVPVPTPIFGGDTVYLTNGHGRWNPIYAVAGGAVGTIDDGFDPEADDRLRWSQRRRGNYMQTPILYRDHLFACTDAGILTCLDPQSGEHLNRGRIGDGNTGFTASPVAAGGHLYFASEAGDVHVVRADPELEVVAINPLGESCMATPAISEGRLFFRTRHHVIAVDAGVESRAPEALAAPTDPEPTPPAEDEAPRYEMPEDAPTPDELFVAHLEARGGAEALARIEFLHQVSESEIPTIGLKIAEQTWIAPRRLLQVSDMPGAGETRLGFDGAVGWMTGAQTDAMLLPAPAIQALVEQLDPHQELRWEEDYRELSLRGRTTFDGRSCWAVSAKDRGGQPVLLHFEVESGLIAGIDRALLTLAGPMQTKLIVREYAEYGGILFPQETLSDFPDQGFSQLSRTLTMDFEPIDESRFALPEEIQALIDEDG